MSLGDSSNRESTVLQHLLQRHIDTIRTIAQQEHLSATCLERLGKAERVVPKMQATIEFVSGYVRQQVKQLELAPPQSFAMHAHLIPSYYLDRVASTRAVREAIPLRELAERLRTPAVCARWSIGGMKPAGATSAPARMWKDATGTSR